MTTTASTGFFLSPQQKFVWTSAASSHSQIAVLIEGTFDEARLHSALIEVVSANEALRTGFRRQTGMKLPFQVLLDSVEPTWTRVPLERPWSESLELARQLMGRFAEPIAPEVSQLRSALFTLDEAKTIWILTAHSAIADSKSMQLLLEQTLKAYSGESGGEEEVLRYVQFAQWQNDLLAADDDAAKEAAAFWAAQESTTPLFPGESNSADASGPSSHLRVANLGDLNRLASSIGLEVTASDIVLAAWTAVIARWSGQQSVEIGVVLEGREFEELANLIGAVSRMAPLVASLKGEPTFSEMASRVHAQCEEMAAVQEYFAPGRPFKVGYEYVALAPPLVASSATFSAIFLNDSSHECALRLNVLSDPSGLRLELEYDAEIIPEATAVSLADSLHGFLSAALAEPGRKISSLPIVSEMSREHLLEMGLGESVSFGSKPMHELIAAQALRTPAAEAVRSGEEILTYGELESRSNQLAHYLLNSGVKAGSLIGLCVARSASMLVPVLAILKAGGAYVPLSSDQPKPRIAQQLQSIEVLITEAQFLDQLPPFEGKLIVLDTAERTNERPWDQQPDVAPEVAVSSDALAYVIYTSGSTGTPKGVGVRHSNLVNYATHIVRALGLDRQPLLYATVSTLAADLGNTVIYPALLTGGCLHVLPYEVATDPKRMAEYQSRYGVDVLKIVPSHLAALIEGAGTDVLPKKYLITGGEALKPGLVERLLEPANASCELINHYGPTETTVGSLMLPLKDYDWKQSSAATIPIGRPIANTRVYVLDQNRQLVPVGVAGELYIAGAGVTAGYVGQPEMTAERFVPDPFSTGEKMYRTGDLVRWLPEGVIEFLGRADDQVKIRGYRVELGEIESLLAAETGVRQSVVIARPRQDNSDDKQPDDKQIVAYVVLDRQQAATIDTLRQALKERLPDYMVPSAIVEMPKLPLTANGKVDRKALPAPEERSAREYKAPATVTEELVAQIWEEVLKLDKISTDQNFFDLGGHSLLATQVISRIRVTLQLEIALRTIFEAPVLADFAAAIDAAEAEGNSAAASAPIKRAARQEYRV